MSIDFIELDRSWTLFIDRDGVINIEKEGDYIYNWDEFRFYPDVRPVLKFFAGFFGRIIVVTNQRGVTKGLMSRDNLDHIHKRMCDEIASAGGRIDKIYICTDLEDDSPCRKPNTGMAEAAKKDFPEIDFHKSVMLGNRESDMRFGKRMGMKTIYLKTTHPEMTLSADLVDESFDHLSDVVNVITTKC